MDLSFSALLHGGDYNPDQWPESVWNDDVRLMGEAGWNVATLPVFGWASLEPEEGTYTFEWLDTVIDKLHTGGIRVCLATATASTPAWVDQAYPDVLRCDNNGLRLPHGNRHTFCPNSPNFRRLSTTLAGKLAERYAQHPAVALWHIGNEYGSPCYCPLCEAQFRVWLQDRYGALEELNKRWYTRFWGKTYTSWSQVEAPYSNGERALQALRIDYDRFQSDSLLNCFIAERDTVRPFNPALPVTTNLMGAFKPLDYRRWAREMDIVSWDAYPGRGALPADNAFSHSLMRGLRSGQPWLLMEQTPSQQNWQPYNALKRPGVMRLWSYQAMAHGADGIMYFQWRRGRGGCEKFHGAVVEHAGRSDARVFREVAVLGHELESLGAITVGSRVDSRAAVLFDWDNWWAIEYSDGPSVDLKYVPQVREYYAALHNNGVPADVVAPDADFTPYAVVIAPLLYMIKPGVASRLEKFVAGGGRLIVTYFSGIVDESDIVFEGGYPGPLRKLLGIWVEETDALSPDESNRLVFDEPFGALYGTCRAGLLCDRIHPDQAWVLATYGSDFYAGDAAFTVNDYGMGRAYYLGARLETEALAALIGRICFDAGVTPPLGAQPADIEVMPRVTVSGRTHYYVLNHAATTERVRLTPGHHFQDLITCAEYIDHLELPPNGVAILTAVEPDQENDDKSAN